MAGDWMKVEHSTPEKPEVFAIATRLQTDPDRAFGICFRMWRWFDQHTADGNAPSVTPALLDWHLGVTGFAQAAIDAGWLIREENGLSLPNFDRHNGQTSKARALTYSRVRSHREQVKRSCNAPSVTEALPETETETENRVREEEEVEEEKKSGVSPEPPYSSRIATADISEVVAHYQTWHPKAKPGAKERAKIAARLKDGYTVEMLQQAIDGCHKSPWHSGENHDGKVYQSLELICRDSAHVQQFLEIATGEKKPVLSQTTQRNMRAAESYIERRFGNGQEQPDGNGKVRGVAFGPGGREGAELRRGDVDGLRDGPG